MKYDFNGFIDGWEGVGRDGGSAGVSDTLPLP